MGLVEIIPVHFVDPNCQHGLQHFIDSVLEDPLFNQLVDEEGSSVAVVEDQGVAEFLWFQVEGALIFEDLVEFFI